MDLDRPYRVRRIFDAIGSQDVVGAVLDLYGEERAAEVLAVLTGPLNGARLGLWEKAGLIYDEFEIGRWGGGNLST